VEAYEAGDAGWIVTHGRFTFDDGSWAPNRIVNVLVRDPEGGDWKSVLVTSQLLVANALLQPGSPLLSRPGSVVTPERLHALSRTSMLSCNQHVPGGHSHWRVTAGGRREESRHGPREASPRGAAGRCRPSRNRGDRPGCSPARDACPGLARLSRDRSLPLQLD
jgi:hypothetical protein